MFQVDVKRHRRDQGQGRFDDERSEVYDSEHSGTRFPSQNGSFKD
jgi:hypothetical protein